MERCLLGTTIRFYSSITFSPRSKVSIAFGSSRPARLPEHIRSDNGPEFVRKAVQELKRTPFAILDEPPGELRQRTEGSDRGRLGRSTYPTTSLPQARRRGYSIAIRARANAPKPSCGWSAPGAWDPHRAVQAWRLRRRAETRGILEAAEVSELGSCTGCQSREAQTAPARAVETRRVQAHPVCLARRPAARVCPVKRPRQSLATIPQHLVVDEGRGPKDRANNPEPGCGWSALGARDPYQCATTLARKWRCFGEDPSPEIGGRGALFNGAKSTLAMLPGNVFSLDRLASD
jgi:hypothetical protein